MSKQIILNCEKLERRVAFRNNGKLEEYEIEHESDAPKVGDIFLGRIVNLDLHLKLNFRLSLIRKKNPSRPSPRNGKRNPLKRKTPNSMLKLPAAGKKSPWKIFPIFSNPVWKCWYRW